MKGIIFNIQKFCIHDGPGIRTTVFLKGCPLRCKWCANPESQHKNIEILWDRKKCLVCKKCIDICASNAIKYKNSRITIDKAQCVGCKKCVGLCPNGALTAEGKYESIENIVEECMKDVKFYEQSSGGVTLSGGEPFYQYNFLKELLKALKKEKIHTAVETSGFTVREKLEEILPYVDLFLYDIKHWNDIKHEEGTGVPNTQILKNLEYLLKKNGNILPRIPIISGFNNEINDAKEFGKLLKSMGLKEVQLLPFHQLGEAKYDYLGRKYELSHLKALQEEELKEFRDTICHFGIHAFF